MFLLLQSSKSFESVIYRSGKAPPWQSRALTAGTITGCVAGFVLFSYGRRYDFHIAELPDIYLVAVIGGLCAIANRWLFKRWW